VSVGKRSREYKIENFLVREKAAHKSNWSDIATEQLA
jgi:hypothetical protein